MLFRKNIEPCCAYCRFGIEIGENEVACRKRGVLEKYDACRRFRYDPLKREPEAAPSLDPSRYCAADFALELPGSEG